MYQQFRVIRICNQFFNWKLPRLQNAQMFKQVLYQYSGLINQFPPFRYFAVFQDYQNISHLFSLSYLTGVAPAEL